MRPRISRVRNELIRWPLWLDTASTAQVLVPQPLDLVLFQRDSDPYGAHIGLGSRYRRVVQPPRVRKAFAYITRGDGLLVFHHRDVPLEEAGVQVPAGTIRDDEPPADAAMREAVEETGLKELALLQYLGSAEYDLRPGRNEIHERHFFHFRAPEDTPDEWVWHEMHDGMQPPTAFCFWWTPLTKAHILAAGMGALVGRL